MYEQYKSMCFYKKLKTRNCAQPIHADVVLVAFHISHPPPQKFLILKDFLFKIIVKIFTKLPSDKSQQNRKRLQIAKQKYYLQRINEIYEFLSHILLYSI